MSIEKYNITKGENKDNKWFDADKIKGDLNVRTRKAGDKINISVGNKKLKNLFARKDDLLLIVFAFSI